MNGNNWQRIECLQNSAHAHLYGLKLQSYVAVTVFWKERTDTVGGW